MTGKPMTADTIPAKGMAKDLALAQARIPAQAGLAAQILDARRQTLQKVPAPIAHIDVVYPFPNQLHPVSVNPGLGDPGAYASASSLEDQ